jgi:hypothetical protein
LVLAHKKPDKIGHNKGLEAHKLHRENHSLYHNHGQNLDLYHSLDLCQNHLLLDLHTQVCYNLHNNLLLFLSSALNRLVLFHFLLAYQPPPFAIENHFHKH